MTFRRLFLLVLGVWAVLVGTASVAVPLAFRDRLPDPIASHWGLGGQPDGALPLQVVLVVHLALWLLVVAVSAATLRRGGIDSRVRRASAVAVLSGGAVFVLGLAALSVRANLDVPGWALARPVRWEVALVLVGAAVVGQLGWFAANRGPDAVGPAAVGGSPMRVPPGQRAVWVSTAASRVLGVIGVVAVAVAALSALVGGRTLPAAWVGVLVGLVCLAMCSVRVAVDERGVRIAFGPQRWPTRHIPTERIRGARAEVHRPWEVGGWGYRVRPDRTAVMLRGGECLVLHLTSGRDFVISVDHPERGAELADAFAAERSATGGE
ncbi:DUF1648 domain-containing protein [Saccharopolyspora rosea]|uniref:DUF1648 domain-containing protein n=1 Tax=Saccharopolyspora rosea TaxID=524884 RepID=A0ABW3FRI7_9PSEU|nr:DUF1648 domain-containing protein [Saccharopolyspora rosea]